MMNAKKKVLYSQQLPHVDNLLPEHHEVLQLTHIFVSTKVILASGYYAAFRVTLVAKALEGMYDGAIHITTDYEVGSC